MPCYVCNPACGQCKGITRQSMMCPECGLIVFPKLVNDGLCPHCHADISRFLKVDQVAVRCNYTLQMCNHPCLRANTHSDGEAHICPFEARFVS